MRLRVTTGAGDKQAPDIVDDRLVNYEMARERGRNYLQSVYTHVYRVSLVVPLQDTLYMPGMALSVTDEQLKESWTGRIISNAIAVEFGRIMQTITLERPV